MILENFFTILKLLTKKKIGISYARNRALYELSKIKTDYLCFVDDDCILDRNWLINNIKVLKKFNVKIITGPHISKNNFYLNITERNLKHESFTDWASTNNVMLNRSIIKSKNRFSLNIQKYGGEDQLFFKKFSNKGIKIIWNQTSKIYDISKKKRINFKWFAQRAIGHGACTLIIYEELNGKIYSYCFCVVKLFYDLTLSIIYTLRFLSFNKKYIYKSLYYFFRAYGNFLSMLSIRKKDINFR